MKDLTGQIGRGRERGATLIELMISLSILLIVGVGVGTRVIEMKRDLQKVSSLMALDAFESSLTDFMRSEEVVRYSISKAISVTLKDCFVRERFCRHKQLFNLDLYREGQDQPFVGETVFYDRNAEICSENCKEGYYVKTAISPLCRAGQTCAGPAYVLVVADIYKIGEAERLRRVVQEVEKYADGKFPGINLQCPNADEVLYGIGLQGEALCVSRNEIQLKDQARKPIGPIAAVPFDCRSLNLTPEHQFFVNEIDATGKIICSPKFW